MTDVGGDVVSGSLTGADLLIYGVLFGAVLLVCVVLVLAVRAVWKRWGPAPDGAGPSREERLRLAVYRLEEAGVDLPAVLGDWSPTRAQQPGPAWTGHRPALLSTGGEVAGGVSPLDRRPGRAG